MKLLNCIIASNDKNSKTIESFPDLIKWIKDSNQNVSVDVREKSISDLENWDVSFDKISHKTGKFFSIQGLRISGKLNSKSKGWCQPIIHQPEVGYLGVICKEFNGVLHFLMQAKVEPGNINTVQISPTIQATKSNFTKVHGGNLPEYFEYFDLSSKSRIIYDELQTEQGSRFLFKKNRNIIVYDNDVKIKSDRFKWLSIYQIKKLMKIDNIVNMDTRSVIGCLPISYNDDFLKDFDSISFENYFKEKNLLLSQDSYRSIEEIKFWITKNKLNVESRLEKEKINKLDEWVFDKDKIYHTSNRFFEVIGVNVKISNREVLSWDQPMIKPVGKGLISIIFARINRVPHFLIRCKQEIGIYDGLSLGPSIQTSFGSLDNDDIFVLDLMKNSKLHFSIIQSEEGGRFYQEQNRNELYEVSFFDMDLSSSFQWMTLSQIHEMIKFSGNVNIELRTILSILPSDL